jgi:two-component system, chemotaxis family, sensor kinase CheA
MSTPDTDDPNAFFAAFMDDYYAESEEHLAIVRRSLLLLEAEVGKREIDAALVNELFRSFHTLKGLSSMVNVREAEELTHHMESYLRLLRDGRATLSEDGLNTLIDGAALLEQVIAAYRAAEEPPAVATLLEQLAALAGTPLPREEQPTTPEPGPGRAVLQADTVRKVAEAQERGLPLWHFIFTPAPELAARGINVNIVRARLEAAGDLIYAAPVIGGDGTIAFEFIMAGELDEATFQPWREEGITYAPYEPDLASLAPLASASVPARMPAVAPATVVRVELARLDELMRLLGDLVISRARIAEHLARFEGRIPQAEWQTLQGVSQMMERQLRDLREGIVNVRMVPIGDVFARMQFVVRDLVRDTGKEVRLEVAGETTEIDKLIVERMMDPLLHLVRNAVSHGFETTAERLAQGKPAEGTLSLTAATDGDILLLDVADDGRGIDTSAVAERARSLDLLAEGEPLEPARLVEILSAPGFSTRIEADRASGRGVGMTVVQDAVQELGGSLEMTTAAGQGTRFSIRLPLTLAIADAFIVLAGNQTFAVPQAAVTEILALPDAPVTHLENNELVLYRGQALPLIRLARFFRLPEENDQYALVFGRDAAAVGLTVARVLGRREIVVRPVLDPLVQVPGVAGATELGDGRLILILDSAALTRAARRQSETTALAGGARLPDGAYQPLRKRDSL